MQWGKGQTHASYSGQNAARFYLCKNIRQVLQAQESRAHAGVTAAAITFGDSGLHHSFVYESIRPS